jgi:hypothetical protein
VPIQKLLIILCIKKKIKEIGFYFLAKEMDIGNCGVILKPCRACMATADWESSVNSTKAMPGFAGIMRTLFSQFIKQSMVLK